MALQLRFAENPEDYALVAQCIRDYLDYLNVDISFQNPALEFASLPIRYGQAGRGACVMAYWDGQFAGSVGLRSLSETRCEMKRMYVYPAFQGHGIGKALAQTVVAAAKRLGYADLVLDTIPRFDRAIALYESLGFVDIPPYYKNPHTETMKVRFMCLNL